MIQMVIGPRVPRIDSCPFLEFLPFCTAQKEEVPLLSLAALTSQLTITPSHLKHLFSNPLIQSISDAVQTLTSCLKHLFSSGDS
jgi:hypothetical protein